MTRTNILGLSTIIALGLLALLPGSAVSQQKTIKDQLVGTWTLVSWELTRADGSRFQRFGANPKGVNTFDANGNFSLIIMRPDLPKISGDPMKVTAEEGLAIARGAIAYFGTYTVNEGDKTLSLKIDATTLVNQLGMEQKRSISSIGPDEMKYSYVTNAAGSKIELVWKRAQ